MKKIFKAGILLGGIITISVLILLVLDPMGFLENVQSNIYEVNDGNDNGRTFVVKDGETGYGNENGSWALLQLSPSYSFGVKFDDIGITKGATIKTAYLELYSMGTPGHRNPNCKIYCDNVDNAANFSALGVLDICGRVYTNNHTLWNTTLPFGEWVKTPSIVSPIQEVVNRKNWKAGNSIAILFVTNGVRGYSATFQNYENGDPARLYIEWTEAT